MPLDVARSDNDERLAALGQYLVTDDAGEMLLAEGEKRSDIVAALDAIQSIGGSPASTRMRLSKGSAWLRARITRTAVIRRDRRPSRRSEKILPDLLEVARSHGLTGNVTVQSGLVERIGGFDNHVVHEAGEVRRIDERFKQVVFLDAQVSLPTITMR